MWNCMMFGYQLWLQLVTLLLMIILVWAASGGLDEVSRDYKKEPLTRAEVERQQILQEMRKKTSLNTDNSWIRQQSSASVTAKEPDDLPMRRLVFANVVCQTMRKKQLSAPAKMQLMLHWQIRFSWSQGGVSWQPRYASFLLEIVMEHI